MEMLEQHAYAELEHVEASKRCATLTRYNAMVCTCFFLVWLCCECRILHGASNGKDIGNFFEVLVQSVCEN